MKKSSTAISLLQSISSSPSSRSAIRSAARSIFTQSSLISSSAAAAAETPSLLSPWQQRSPARSPIGVAARSFRTTEMRNDVIHFLLADIGEGIRECELLQWFVKEGDLVNEFDKVCGVQSDKATVEITSRFTGVVRKLHAKVGEMVIVGKPLIDIEIQDSSSHPSASSPSVTHSDSSPTSPSLSSSSAEDSSHYEEGAVFATPAVRRIAKENNINLKLVKGTGKDGRVLKEDVLQFVESETQQKSAQPSAPIPKSVPPPKKEEISAPAPKPIVEAPSIKREDRREPLRGFKRAMVRSMNEAWQKIPHFGYKDDILMNDLIEFRNNMKDIAKERGIRLSFMPIFIKAASLAINQYPILNSSLTPDESEIIYKASHNIGIAMDTPQGLVVPNIKNVQDKSIFDVAKELNRLQDVGSKGQFSPSDLSDGTFTLSNIGTIGGTYTQPVIVFPQVCIGAVGKVAKVPRYNAKGDIYAASIMNVSWSADHRIIDGATMARFSNAWKLYLESPTSMLLDLK